MEFVKNAAMVVGFGALGLFAFLWLLKDFLVGWVWFFKMVGIM